MVSANVSISLTSLSSESGSWFDPRAVQRFSQWAVASRHRHPVDLASGSTRKAKAIYELIAKMKCSTAD
jgi:hypothetical protein